MGERELTIARARVEKSKRDFVVTTGEIKYRLAPSTLASDAWHGFKDKSTEVSQKGVQAVTDRPAAAGGIVAAIALFLLRGPLASLLSRLFGSGRDQPGRVTTDLSSTDKGYDLTAPVVPQNKGVTT